MKLQVVAVSSNTNAFGLRGHVFISDNGQGWEAGANPVNTLKRGAIVEFDDDAPAGLTRKGFEIPRRLPDPPPELMREIWG